MRRLPIVVGVFAIGALVGTALTGITTPSGQVRLAAAAPQPERERTLRVERGDIVATITLAGDIVAEPEFVVEAPAAGAWSPEPIAPGTFVPAGGVLGHVGSTALLAPSDAIVVKRLVERVEKIPLHLPLVRLRTIGFAMRADISGADAYRVLASAIVAGRASIEQGPGPFDCRVVSAPVDTTALPEAGAPATAGQLPVLCLIPTDVRAVAGVPGELLLRSERVEDVLTVPVVAVAGTVDSGEVIVVEDGRRSRRRVALGITDGINVAIISGLTEGETITATAPRLDEVVTP
jgi:hypothetical protein